MNWTSIVALLPAILAELAKTFPSASSPATAPVATDPTAMNTLLASQSVFIKHAQEILNAARATGLVSFDPPLTIDGVVGPKTNAAMQAIMTKYGVTA